MSSRRHHSWGGKKSFGFFTSQIVRNYVSQSKESILQQTNLLHLHLFAIPTSTLKLLHYFYTNLNNENFEIFFHENRNFSKRRENHMFEIIVGQGRPSPLGVDLRINCPYDINNCPYKLSQMIRIDGRLWLIFTVHRMKFSFKKD